MKRSELRLPYEMILSNYLYRDSVAYAMYDSSDLL